MTFTTFQNYQTTIEQAARSLASEQLALVQKCANDYKNTLETPNSFNAAQQLSDGQAMLQKMLNVNQQYMSTVWASTQAYIQEQLEANQNTIVAPGFPLQEKMTEFVEQMQNLMRVPNTSHN